MRKTQKHQPNLTENVHETSVSFNTPQNFISKFGAATEPRPEASEIPLWQLRATAGTCKQLGASFGL